MVVVRSVSIATITVSLWPPVADAMVLPPLKLIRTRGWLIQPPGLAMGWSETSQKHLVRWPESVTPSVGCVLISLRYKFVVSLILD